MPVRAVMPVVLVPTFMTSVLPLQCHTQIWPVVDLTATSLLRSEIATTVPRSISRVLECHDVVLVELIFFISEMVLSDMLGLLFQVFIAEDMAWVSLIHWPDFWVKPAEVASVVLLP